MQGNSRVQRHKIKIQNGARHPSPPHEAPESNQTLQYVPAGYALRRPPPSVNHAPRRHLTIVRVRCHAGLVEEENSNLTPVT